MFDTQPGTDHDNPSSARLPSHSAIVTFPDDEILNDDEFLWRVASDLGDLPLSRRMIPDWIADCFYNFPGKIVDHSGLPVKLGSEDIDEAFSNEGSFRWLSDFIRMDFLSPKLRKQKVQGRVLHRLRLIVAALEIEKLTPNFTGEEMDRQSQRRWAGKRLTLDRPRPLARRSGASRMSWMYENDNANLMEIVNSGVRRGLAARVEARVDEWRWRLRRNKFEF